LKDALANPSVSSKPIFFTREPDQKVVASILSYFIKSVLSAFLTVKQKRKEVAREK
jgi:hypothetical protein